MGDTLHFTHGSGASRKIRAVAYQADGTTILNLTGVTIRWTAEPYDGSAPAVALTTTAGITVTDAAAGEFDVDIPKGRLLSPAGRITRWAHSCVAVQAGVEIDIFGGVIGVYDSPAGATS